jgi:cytochrome c oxidase subunit 1
VLATHLAPANVEPRNYLKASYTIKSWLLTQDHKHIAILYLIGVTFFFIVGGLLAMALRLELLTPDSDMMAMDTYNKVFTMHSVVMIFFVLIPAVPAVLGNFLLLLMLGARDLAFPRLNLLSWYFYVIGALLLLYTVISGGVDAGWTFTTPLSTRFVNTNVISASLAAFVAGFLSLSGHTTRPPSSWSSQPPSSPSPLCLLLSNDLSASSIPLSVETLCSSSVSSGSTPNRLST